MKKYIKFTLHYLFFITSLLFLPNEVSLFFSCMLISVLALENIAFTILPLVICLYMPKEHTYIILILFIIHLVFNKLHKKNRFYAFGIYLLSNLSSILYFIYTKSFSNLIAQSASIALIIYSIINVLHSYQKIENKNIIVPYNSKLIILTLLLGYLLIFNSTNAEQLLYHFLFIQLFIVADYKYNIIFSILLTLTIFLNDASKISQIPSIIACSFLPPTILLKIDYTNYSWIIYLLYTIISTITFLKKKKITIENNYINSLFDDFNKYLNNLNHEYNKCIKLKELKEKTLYQISEDYCNNCIKETLCKKRLDKRYSFLSAAMLGMDQNIYDCPHYQNFDMQVNIDNAINTFEYSAIKTLAFELSTLYNQSLLRRKEYEKFIAILSEYGYIVSNIDINFSQTSTYFSIIISSNKPIIMPLLQKCAFLCFGEKLEIKRVDSKFYFFKKPLIKISYAHTVLAKEGNLISGDNYLIKKDHNSSYIFALSDGMGNGYNAYIESIDALKTISKLTSYHFRTQTILKLLEDIYELRSNYDRYATLDFLTIDSSMRKANLYKMGSTTTYILHNNKLNTYENRALPLKLDDINSAYELDIFSGDYIFLLSDGISDFVTPEEFYSLIKDTTAPADELCYKIINHLKKKENNNLKDDLSLIVIKAI